MPSPRPADGFSRQASLGYLSYRLAHLFARTLDDQLAGHGVGIGQFRMLLVLWEGVYPTQAEMARLLDVEQPTVAATLRRMERDGLVDITTDPEDGRRRRVRLTERGRGLREPLTALAAKVNDAALQELSPAEARQFAALLTRVTGTLERGVEG